MLDEIKDLREFIEEKVIDAYYEVLENLMSNDIIPNLRLVYDTLVSNIVDDIYDAYESVFGDAIFREDWLQDLGIDSNGIPHMLTACEILNAYKLGYEYLGVIYNFFPQRLLWEVPII